MTHDEAPLIPANDVPWSFESEQTAAGFDDHIEQSVPLYRDSQQLVLDLLPFFLSARGARIVDVGCSTGSFFELVSQRFKDSGSELIGIDVSEEMINYATRSRDGLATFIQGNYLNLDTQDLAVCVSFYTLQFVLPRDRQALYDKVYNDLNWGGGFFLFEKVRATDARFQDMMTDALNQYKERRGFTLHEIHLKSRSLRGILEPFSSAGNDAMLARAGFKDVEVIMRYGPFEGKLAIK